MIFYSGCAVPVSPTGGPRDTEGPVILKTEPANEAVNVTGRRVVIHFNEYTDRNSVRQNIRLEPDLDLPFTVEFKKKRAEILFEKDFPENTTLALHLQSAISDVLRNRMSTAQKIAFSTGPELSRGEVRLNVRTVAGERTDPGTTIYLFRHPVNLETDKATYIAEPDTSGTAVFSYLSEGRYTALWFDDLDRDRTWDAEREPAQPVSTSSFDLPKDSTIHLGSLTLQKTDTTRPVILGVGVPFQDRLRLRFNKPIIPKPESLLILRNKKGEEVTRAYPIPFPTADDEVPNTLFFQTAAPLNEDSLYTVHPQGLADVQNRPLVAYLEAFSGNDLASESGIRYTDFHPSDGLNPFEPVEFVYSGFVQREEIRDSLKVIINNELQPISGKAELIRNRLRVYPGEEGWAAGNQYRFLVWDPSTEEYRSVEPEIWYPHRLGEVEVALADSALRSWNLRLFKEPFELVEDTLMTSRMHLRSLRPGTYHLQLFLDKNGNGVWDQGQVQPYIEPEQILIKRDIPVTEGFTSEVQMFPDQIPD